MTFTHVFFDFNGTLLNDTHLCRLCADRLLIKHGVKPLGSDEAYRASFFFPLEDYYRQLGFDFEKTPYPRLAQEWFDDYLLHETEPPLFEGAKETVAAVRALGLSPVVFSACEQGLMEKQLKDRGLFDCFDAVLGQDNLLAEGKLGTGKRFLRAHPDARVLLVGDTTHDVECAAALGFSCLLVPNGYQDAARLKSAPYPRLGSLRRLPSWLKQEESPRE